MPSTLILPSFKILSASCIVLATLSTSRSTIPSGYALCFGWGPGLTLRTNWLCFLLMAQNVGAICLFTLVSPPFLPIIRQPPLPFSLPCLLLSRSEEHTSELQSRENLVC